MHERKRNLQEYVQAPVLPALMANVLAQVATEGGDKNTVKRIPLLVVMFIEDTHAPYVFPPAWEGPIPGQQSSKGEDIRLWHAAKSLNWHSKQWCTEEQWDILTIDCSTHTTADKGMIPG